MKSKTGREKTYRFLNKLSGGGVELKSGLHLKLVPDFNLAILRRFESCIDFFSSSDPEDLKFYLIGTVPQEQLPNGHLKL